jgi:DNA-binding MarR family transcriptional regulator
MSFSQRAALLVMDVRFRPSRRTATFGTEDVVDCLGCDADQASACLVELERNGLVEHVDAQAPTYRATPAGSLASERTWRERKRRRKPLLAQLSYPLNDLIVAIIYEPHAFNRRLPGGVWGTVPIFPLVDLIFFLRDWPEESVRSACSELEKAGMLKSSRDQEQREYVELTPKALRYYTREIRAHFGLPTTECLLDAAPAGLRVFFAWQSEVDASRSILTDAIPKVIGDLNRAGTLIQEMTLVHASEPGQGALRIDSSLQERIRSADYFIADLTAVHVSKGRLRVNDNVLIETGFALASKPEDRVILMALRDPPIDGDGSANPQMAFDIAHVRRLGFLDAQDAEHQLSTELRIMLSRDGWLLD